MNQSGDVVTISRLDVWDGQMRPIGFAPDEKTSLLYVVRHEKARRVVKRIPSQANKGPRDSA